VKLDPADLIVATGWLLVAGGVMLIYLPAGVITIGLGVVAFGIIDAKSRVQSRRG